MALGRNEDALRSLIGSYTGEKAAEIPRDTIFDDLGLDSLQAVELSEYIAEKFSVKFASEELILSTLGNVLRRISEKEPREVAADDSPTDPVKSEKPQREAEMPTGSLKPQDERRQELMEMISKAAEVEVDQIRESHTLSQLGLDPLTTMELEQDLDDTFPAQFKGQQITPETTVVALMKLLGINSTSSSPPARQPHDHSVKANVALEISPVSKPSAPSALPNPFSALAKTDASFDAAASKRGYLSYWTTAAPLFDDLFLAYLSAAFTTLGIDLPSTPPGSTIPPVPHLPKYARLVDRLTSHLASRSVLARSRTGHLVRGPAPLPPLPPATLAAALASRLPAYAPETRLLQLVAPHLAAVLRGDASPVAVMFGTPAALEIVAAFYADSPMMATLTDQLVAFLGALLRGARPLGRPVRILEVGAGTGGTTARLAGALAAAGAEVAYAFTDVSPAFVARARRRFAAYAGWMEFAVLDLERDDAGAGFRGRFDVVLGANVVHATSDRTAACTRLREMLRPGGLVVLSEVTREVAWYDIVFGLLDGWWLAEDGKGYPIMDADGWMAALRKAGFKRVGYSGVEGSAEAESQQLLVGSMGEWDGGR